MFDSSVYFDIVRLWSLESQPAGLSLASYSSVIIHWKKWFCINNSVTCTWTVHWVILTDRCCAQRFQKYRRYLPYPCSRLFFLFSRSQCFSHRFFHLFFFDSLCLKSVAVLQLRPSRGWGACQDSCLSPPSWCYFACFTKVWWCCLCSAPGQQEPFCWRLSLEPSGNAEHTVPPGSPQFWLEPGTLHMVLFESDPLFFSGYFSDCRDHFEFCPWLQDTCNPL